eukprot:Tbor_TRINITY_DN2751_c0_g1::TRINITY_DN2751_c0_g1_i1::g.15218::m.15218/K18669/DYRK2_3_4; dual specificity tyrosine-phosphorylation-regulated kinase 2/3/4
MTHLPAPPGVRPAMSGNTGNGTVFPRGSRPVACGLGGFEILNDITLSKNTNHIDRDKDIPLHVYSRVNGAQQSKYNILPLGSHQYSINGPQSSRLPPANTYQLLPGCPGGSSTSRRHHQQHTYCMPLFPDINGGDDVNSCLPVIKQQQVGGSNNNKTPPFPSSKPSNVHHGSISKTNTSGNHYQSHTTFYTRRSSDLISSSTSDPSAVVAFRTRNTHSVSEEAPFMTPQQVLDEYSQYLTGYETAEILTFEKVYFFGKGAKKVLGTPLTDIDDCSSSGVSPANNYGYDDSDGDYRVVIGDHCAYRYEIQGELGRGSFGQVTRALDHKTGQLIALKIIKNKKKFRDQSLIEIGILEALRDNDTEKKFNVVKIIDSFVFRNHMMIVFELHGMNLYEMCRSVNFNPLPIYSIRKIAQQIILTLYFCKELKIVHCDLKPENVLLCLNENRSGSGRRVRSHSASGFPKSMLVAGGQVDLATPKLRVIDFGSSCYEHKRLYTYIQSRFYRAPEVMLGIPYTTAIDMWSFGCILAELSNGYPIFPGETENDQMLCIMEYLGVPGKDLLDRSPRWRHFFDNNGMPLPGPPKKSGKPSKPKRPGSKEVGLFLRSGVKEKDHLFVEFVSKCLEWDPVKRITPNEAIRHPWLQFSDMSTLSTEDSNMGGNVSSKRRSSLFPKIVNSRKQ